MRRWIAQRALTREWLHWDLPIDAYPTVELSGVGSVRFTLPVEVAGLDTPDSFRMFEPWSTLLYLEVDEVIQWGGVVVDNFWVDQEHEIEVASFATYPHGQVWTGNYVGVESDPANVIRYIWNHLQGKPDGGLGVTVQGTTSLKLGSTSTREALVAVAAENAAKAALDAAKKAKAPEAEIDRLQSVYDRAKDAATAAKDRESEDGGEYRFDWWDNPDCGDEIDRVTDEMGLEWVESHRWNVDRSDVLHEIHVKERFGTRRTDLRFAVGENVIQAVPFDIDGDLMATEVAAIGAGEGKKALRETAAKRTGRLRRARVVEAKDVSSRPRLATIARTEQASRSGALDVQSIVVSDHPNAPFGSWVLGDEVQVSGDVPWLGRVAVWRRIVAERWLSADAVELVLRP